jgi:hypothetical protein
MTENEAVAVERATTEIEQMLRLGDRQSRYTRPTIAPVIEQPPESKVYINPGNPNYVAPPDTVMKIDHTLIPIDALEEVSRALMYGKEKHGAWGWIQNPKSYTELLAKTQRHIFEFQRGVTYDPATGLSHIACAICDLMFLQSNILKERGTDDRLKD